MDSKQKKRVTASEREGMMRIFVAAEMLMDEAKTKLPQRTAMIPKGRWMVAGLAGLAKKLTSLYLETVPDDQMKSMLRTMQSISYTVGVKKPGSGHSHNDEYGMWVSFNLLNELLEGIHDHCQFCDLDGQHRRSCKLRKALDEIPNEVEQRDDGDCPYFTVL